MPKSTCLLAKSIQVGQTSNFRPSAKQNQLLPLWGDRVFLACPVRRAAVSHALAMAFYDDELLLMGDLPLAGDIGMDIMSTKQIAEARRIFEKIDKDKDDKLNRDELALAFRHYGKNPTNAEFNKMAAEVGRRPAHLPAVCAPVRPGAPRTTRVVHDADACRRSHRRAAGRRQPRRVRDQT